MKALRIGEIEGMRCIEDSADRSEVNAYYLWETTVAATRGLLFERISAGRPRNAPRSRFARIALISNQVS